MKFSLSFLSIFITCFGILYLVDYLPSFYLVLFLEIFPVLLFGACFFVSSFWLPLCFCRLSRSSMSPSLVRVALYSRCPVGPSDANSLITWAGCSWNVICMHYVCFDCCWTIHTWGRPSSWQTVRSSPAWTAVHELLCRRWPHKAEFASAGFDALWALSLNGPLVKLIGSRSDVSEADHWVCWFWDL